MGRSPPGAWNDGRDGGILTGGWIAKRSRWSRKLRVVRPRFVTYTYASKREMLDVREHTLEQHGAAPRPSCARWRRARSPRAARRSPCGERRCGPIGLARLKAVGTVCFAWATKMRRHGARHEHFEGDRESVRRHRSCMRSSHARVAGTLAKERRVRRRAPP